MDVVEKADRLARSGRAIYHLEVGQPQSSAPQSVLDRACTELMADNCGYTSARGIMPLRTALVEMYQSTYGVVVSPESIFLTPGSSGAFTISFMAAFDIGDAVATPSCCYPCYRNLLKTYGCEAISLPVNAQYNVTAKELEACQRQRAEAGLPPIKGLILSSPANPTGAMLTPEELKELCDLCDVTGVQFISDEIYHGIVFQGAPRAACALEFSQRPIIINSFSKYYSMTGWRLGWMVVPEHLNKCTEALNQNMNVCAPSISQRAAVASLSGEAKPELLSHVARYEANRRIIMEGLTRMGIHSYAEPMGAFYLYADLGSHGVTDSLAFCDALLEEAGVAMTPGVDFEEKGSRTGGSHVRFGFPGSSEDVQKAMDLFAEWWMSPSALKLRGNA